MPDENDPLSTVDAAALVFAYGGGPLVRRRCDRHTVSRWHHVGLLSRAYGRVHLAAEIGPGGKLYTTRHALRSFIQAALAPGVAA